MTKNDDAARARRTTGRRLLLAGATLLTVVGSVAACASTASTPAAAPAAKTGWTSSTLAVPAAPAVHAAATKVAATKIATTNARAVDITHPGTRADVPWSKVGSGWNVATWAPKQSARTTMFLIAPNGARYDVAHLPAQAEPMMWSPDGRRVLLYSFTGDNRYTEVDLHTGRLHVFALPFSDLLAYSRPRGLAVLANVYADQGGRQTRTLERFGIDGRHQLTYPAAVRGAGELRGAPTETPDGSELVVGAQHGLVLLRNDGTVVRRLNPTAQSCGAGSWWSRGTVLAACGENGGEGTLWAVPISGAAPTRLSDGVTDENPFGYSTIWRFSGGRLGLSPNGCGPQSLVRFDGLHGNRFTPATPHGAKGRSFYVGHHGDIVTLGFHPNTGCQGEDISLYAYNAVTGRATTLLGPGVNGGSVLGTVAFSTDK